MKIKAVLNYESPSYPTLDEFVSSPLELISNAPDKWNNNKIVWAALASFALNSQGCDYVKNKHTRYEIIQSLKNDSEKSQFESSFSDSSFVAPLFQHGDGIGAYGCVVIMPPVFINEQEAKQIILNEFKKDNLLFDTISQPENKIIIKSQKKLWYYSKGDYAEKDTTEFNELKFDGYNKELNLAFCFVSKKNHSYFSDYEPESSSLGREDYMKTAEKLRHEIKKSNNLKAVIFYEPLPYPIRDKNSERLSRNERKIEGRRVAVDSLKSQVADFIEWLKIEKIILK